ncbi:casein kinase-related [Holotrichia oblita]|uniref:Casein kinase-related n=1 Tax=Holotrichia oblita TaxID=644536 RepID=A0ACB9TW43_HOLOL|nr:casein kinase-related [Holotrichia oblita]
MRRRASVVCSEEGPPRKRNSGNNNTPTIDIKPGEVLTDLCGKKWRLGKAIGIGGFGEIFLASDNIDDVSKASSNYVAKVETHSNGPLFVEVNCYLRIAKRHMIEEWKAANELDTLGMPYYIASGSHRTKDSKLRFLIIPRFEKDLEQVFQSKKRKFNLKTVLVIAAQLIDTLEYIHSNGYVHSDVKASNILLQHSKKEKFSRSALLRHNGTVPLRSCRIKKLMLPLSLRPNGNLRYYDLTADRYTKKEIDQVYLLDYGLASKYLQSNGEHKEFCSDQRRAHAGTILFCSLDAHKGAQSRRSDLESLGYNMIYWLTSKLPWMDDIDEPEIVHKRKQKCIANLDEFLTNSFTCGYPKFLYEYFQYLIELEFEAKPDYKYCKTLFEEALKEYGYKENQRFDFDNLEGWGNRQKRLRASLENKRSPKITYKLNRIPLTSNLPIRPILRKKAKNKKNAKLNWSKILIDPEIILKQGKSRDRKITETSDSGTSLSMLDINQLNPTYAMMEVYNKSVDKMNSGCSPRYKGDSCSDCLDGYTPAMMTVYNRKKEREELELEKLMCNTKKVCSKVAFRSSTRNKLKRQVVQSSKNRHSKSTTGKVFIS